MGRQDKYPVFNNEMKSLIIEIYPPISQPKFNINIFADMFEYTKKSKE